MAERSQPSAGQESHEGTADRASQGEPTTEVVNAEDVIHRTIEKVLVKWDETVDQGESSYGEEVPNASILLAPTLVFAVL